MCYLHVIFGFSNFSMNYEAINAQPLGLAAKGLFVIEFDSFFSIFLLFSLFLIVSSFTPLESYITPVRLNRSGDQQDRKPWNWQESL